MKVAVILPRYRWDYLANTVVDGLFQFQKKQSLDFRVSSQAFFGVPAEKLILQDELFVQFASEADLILLCYGKEGTDVELAERIHRWDRTVFVDGSELGKDRRYDPEIRRQVLEGTWVDQGRVDHDMLATCALYVRREKPYINGIIPLPYGIESRFIRYTPETQKDVDFCCIFGQEQYPVLRREVREKLEQFCAENGYTCVTRRTKDRDTFYDLLARSKVGISVGGGGFDTARFWEILANNCLLMTETIDIFPPGGKELDFKRITQFGTVGEFSDALETVAAFLKNEYTQVDTAPEYQNILAQHSSGARVETIINAARDAHILNI